MGAGLRTRSLNRIHLGPRSEGFYACRPVLHIAGDADFRMRISRFALVALQSAICAFKAGSR